MKSVKSTLHTDSSQDSRSEPYELPQQVTPSARRLRAPPGRAEISTNPHVDQFFSREMELGVETLKEHLVELAESYHGPYQAHKAQRMNELKNLYEAIGQPDDVIVMLYCKNFFPLFKNWLASCASHDIIVNEKLITFTLDEESSRETKALGIKNYYLDPDIYAEAGGAVRFGDKQFSKTMFYKNAIILDILELGANVLFQDVDIIWLRDPFDYISVNCNDRDIYIMFDGPNPFHRPLYANTGFIYAVCNDASKALFETALRNTASIFQTGSHQMPLNRIMEYFIVHNVLSVKVLPQVLFLNGHLFNLKQGVREHAGDWQKNGFVVHYSWTNNREEKRQKIEKFGFNYLPDENIS